MKSLPYDDKDMERFLLWNTFVEQAKRKDDVIKTINAVTTIAIKFLERKKNFYISN